MRCLQLSRHRNWGSVSVYLAEVVIHL